MTETPPTPPSLDDRVTNLEATVFHQEQVFTTALQAIRNKLNNGLTPMADKPHSLDDRLSNIEATTARLEKIVADFDKAIVAIKTKLDRKSSSSYQK